MPATTRWTRVRYRRTAELLGILSSVLMFAIPVRAQHRFDIPDVQPDTLSFIHADTLWRVGNELNSAPEETFGWLAGMAVDHNGNILVVDGYAQVIRMFDGTGSFAKETGRKGRGPGEFMLPVAVGVDDDGAVYVYDPALQRITQFSADLKFTRTINLEKGIVSVSSVLVTDSVFVITGVLYENGLQDRAIHLFKKDTGSHLRSFGDLPPAETPILRQEIGAGRVYPSVDGNIWYTQVAPYLIEKFSLSGELLIEIRRSNTFLPPADFAYTVRVKDGRMTTTSRPHPTAIVVREMDDGTLIHQINLMNGTYVTDVFSPSFELIRSTVGPPVGLYVRYDRDRYVIQGGGVDEPQWFGLVKVELKDR